VNLNGKSQYVGVLNRPRDRDDLSIRALVGAIKSA
jgi:hypothetical protein